MKQQKASRGLIALLILIHITCVLSLPVSEDTARINCATCHNFGGRASADGNEEHLNRHGGALDDQEEIVKRGPVLHGEPDGSVGGTWLNRLVHRAAVAVAAWDIVPVDVDAGSGGGVNMDPGGGGGKARRESSQQTSNNLRTTPPPETPKTKRAITRVNMDPGGGGGKAKRESSHHASSDPKTASLYTRTTKRTFVERKKRGLMTVDVAPPDTHTDVVTGWGTRMEGSSVTD
jgi:hypothetical protein